jgi:hypothetical protein
VDDNDCGGGGGGVGGDMKTYVESEDLIGVVTTCDPKGLDYTALHPRIPNSRNT